MSLESEMRARFGGIWNSLLLLFVIIICLRFSSIAFAEDDLGARVHCSIHLFLGCLAAGLLMGLLRMFLATTNDTYTRAPGSANFASGMKYGILAAGFLILIAGMIQLDGFLGPFQPILDVLFAKLLDILA
jgi:cytochrome b561